MMTSSLFSQDSKKRLILLGLLIVGIATAHYFTSVALHYYHNIYRRLFYLPIIFGAFWFGRRGGLGVAFVTSLVYLPHVLIQWQARPTQNLDQFLEMLMFHVVGGLTGMLVEQVEHRQAQLVETNRRLEAANAEIRASYEALKRQSEALLQAEEALMRKNRLASLGELLANMAHELRTPLGSIKGVAEIFRDKLPEDDKLHELSKILVLQVDRLNHVVENLLQFVRSGPKTQGGRAQVGKIVTDVLDLSYQRAEAGRIEIVTTMPPELPSVAIDPEPLQQVLLNLVVNAIQAMPEGGRLEILARDRGDDVEISVSDTGCGIPPEVREKIFDPFFTTKAGGTGLGLSICERIVSGFGGLLTVTSEVGEGTTFTVALPKREGS